MTLIITKYDSSKLAPNESHAKNHVISNNAAALMPRLTIEAELGFINLSLPYTRPYANMLTLGQILLLLYVFAWS